MNSKKIAFGSDHAGFQMKQHFLQFIQNKGIQCIDFGCFSEESVDYPDFVHPVAKAIESGNADFGFLFCGSGNGVAIAANKHLGIRAALCWNNEVTALSRLHNDANILCIPARFIDKEVVSEMILTFLSTGFEGGRHQKRVEKISIF
jgi:ribose 5-phosphate isomerase B